MHQQESSHQEARDKLLTVREVAAQLNVGVRTVWRLLSAGELRRVRIGRAVRVHVKSVDDLIERGGTR